MSLSHQIVTLFVLAIPIACVSWTVTHEDVFREPREWLARRSETARHLWQRKLFYACTCEYCFSHYVTIAALAVTRYTLVYPDWRGYVVAGFSLVWIANVYMSMFGRLRLEIRHERKEIEVVEEVLEQTVAPDAPDASAALKNREARTGNRGSRAIRTEIVGKK